MIVITKQEAKDLRKIVGEEYVKKTYSRCPTYFLVEDRYHKTVEKLNQYRNAKIVK